MLSDASDAPSDRMASFPTIRTECTQRMPMHPSVGSSVGSRPAPVDYTYGMTTPAIQIDESASELRPWDVVTTPEGTWALIASIEAFAWSRDVRCDVWLPTSQQVASYGGWQLVKQPAGPQSERVVESYRRWRRT